MEIKIKIPISNERFERLGDIDKFMVACKCLNSKYEWITKASKIQLYGKDGGWIGCGAFNMRLIGVEPLDVKFDEKDSDSKEKIQTEEF